MEPNLAYDENPFIQLSDSSQIRYHTGQAASYSCELEYNLVNKIKSQISNVQYGNLLLRF